MRDRSTERPQDTGREKQLFRVTDLPHAQLTGAQGLNHSQEEAGGDRETMIASGKHQRPGDGGCAEKGQRRLLGWKGQKWRDGSYQMEGTEVGSEDRLRTEKKRKEWY